MTLVLAVSGRQSAWVLADRRLSYGKARPPDENGRKVMTLECDDGFALLAYAGLGRTARGTEPADWMSAVLRGRKLTVERSLGAIAAAVQKEMPFHLWQLAQHSTSNHHVIAAAFVDDEPRFYSIDLVADAATRTFWFRYTRHVMEPAPGVQVPHRLMVGGAGAIVLAKDRSWMRPLRRLVAASDRGRIKPTAVADYLAALNYRVHLAEPDGTVGLRSIAVWRHRKTGKYKGGGGQRYYTAANAEPSSPSIPTIASGMDVHALVETMMPLFIKWGEQSLAGGSEPVWDEATINAALARLPDKPDEKLR